MIILMTENINIKETLIRHFKSSFPGTKIVATIPIQNRTNIRKFIKLLILLGEFDYEIVVNKLL